MNKASSHFKTSNTALAAYLVSEGFELLDKAISDNKVEVVFIFCNDSKQLQELVRSFSMGKATGNIIAFYNNYKQLVNIAQREVRLYGKGK